MSDPIGAGLIGDARRWRRKWPTLPRPCPYGMHKTKCRICRECQCWCPHRPYSPFYSAASKEDR